MMHHSDRNFFVKFVITSLELSASVLNADFIVFNDSSKVAQPLSSSVPKAMEAKNLSEDLIMLGIYVNL